MRDQTFKPLGQLKAAFDPKLVGVGWLRGGVQVLSTIIATGGDTNGLYIMPTGKVKFTDLINTSIMPASTFTETDHTPDGSIWGCQAMALYPGDGNIGAFVMNNIIYKSTNLLSANPTLTKIGGPYPSNYWGANTNGMFAWPKAQFDPQNSNVLVIGTQNTAILTCTNFMSGTPTVNTVTVGMPGSFESSPCCHAVGFDPTSTVSGGQLQTLYFSTYGSGIYKSTTGVAGITSATLVTSTPANVNSFKVAVNGDVYACNGGESTNGNLYKKPVASGSFTKCPGMPSYAFWDVAINPTNTNQVVVVVEQAMVFAESMDGGATWLGNDIWNSAYPVGMNLTPRDAGWMMARDANGVSTRKPQTSFGGQSGNIEWDPSGTWLYCATGQGLMRAKPPTVWNLTSAAAWNWQEISLGISQAVVTDVFNPPSGNYPTQYCMGDFCVMEGLTPSSTKSQIPQKPVQSNRFDQTAWSVESAPAPNADFLTLCAGYWDNVHSYRTSPNQPWTPFTGSFPRTDQVQGAGVLLPYTPNDIFGLFVQNSRPVITHDGGASWGYGDTTMSGMITKPRGWAGSGNGLMIFTDVLDWTGVQNVRVVVNAASGGGSVTVSGSNPTVITVVPAAGANSCLQVAAQVNANAPAAALVTATYGGTGANAVITGTYDVNYFYSGWSWVGIGFIEPMRGACLDKTTGNMCCYNVGDEVFGTAAPWAGIWKYTKASNTWSHPAGCPGGISSVAGHHIREVLGKTDHYFFHGQRNTPLYFTSNAWATSAPVGDGLGNFFSNVLWAHTGKAAPNQNYPSIYVAGTLNGTTALWACWDGTWTNWYNYSNILIGGLGYNINRFDADANVFGKIDGCFYQGAWGGTYDYKSVAA